MQIIDLQKGHKITTYSLCIPQYVVDVNMGIAVNNVFLW